MAILITLIPRQIDTTIPLLVVDITREIIIEIISRPGNTRAISLLDQPETVLVDFLEQERRIVASEVPSALDERVGLSVESGFEDEVICLGAKGSSTSGWWLMHGCYMLSIVLHE